MEFQPVPLLDLKAQYALIKDEIARALEPLYESQMFVLGPEVQALEDEIAAYSQCRHAIGVTSGTDALLIALMALGVAPGDEVITTAYTFFATAGVIHRLGARPVFVDIEPETFNISPDRVEAAITPKTKAIIPVHLYGQCAEMAPILGVAEKHGLPVIEDAAQAIGAEYQGRRAGSMGTVGCFSFFPTKNLGGFGDGGMVTVNDDALAEKLRVLRVHGMEPKYYHPMVGGNFRLDAIQAAVLRVKLRHLDDWSDARKRNAERYDRLFDNAGLTDGRVVTPPVKQSRHVFNQYVIRVQRRDELKRFLSENGVGCEVYYPVPLHLQECFADLGYKPGDLPVSEEAAQTTLALPIYPELTGEMQARVVDCVARFYNGLDT
ncbi:MAG: aminotransferase class V-fold PLP-dependent enzyme [bacterium]|nr:aminotransferase class V-fold PLP-dependent enzyme [bacterium]